MMALKRIYREQAFHPGILGIWLNPFYLARSGLVKAIKIHAPMLSGALLDVGCGTKPYQRYFSVSNYTGLDIDSETTRARACADILYDGGKFPIEAQRFDSVICNQVLEHVFNPDDFLQEINRVMKDEGKLLLTVPFVWDEHEQPYDFARYSSFGLKFLLQKNGFTVLAHKKINADASVMFQLANAYLYKCVVNWPKPIRAVLTATLMAGVTIAGILAKILLPANNDLFLDQVVVATKNKPSKREQEQRN